MSQAKVYEAIAAVMAHMAKEGISKDNRNQQQGYNFRGIDDIYNALGKVLAEHKLLMLPRVVESQREERQSAKGGLLMYTILTVEFDLVSADDGSTHMVRMIGEAMDSADKSSNKAQSAALKYAALQVFMIPTKGDNDADATTHEVIAAPRITDDQRSVLMTLLEKTGADTKAFCTYYNIGSLPEMPASKYEDARMRLSKKLKPEDGDGTA